MPRAGFYNDNEYRQYPFVAADPDNLPTDLIVDCGFIMGLDSGFDAATDVVYLRQVRKTIDKIEFEFRTTARNAASSALVFQRNFNAEEWSTEFLATASSSKECAAEPLWEGFMVSGVMTTIVELLPVNGVITFTTAEPFKANRVVEPGRVQSLVKSYLRSISLGNYPRIIIPTCINGRPGIIEPSNAVIVNSRCLKGDIRFKPGFNCSIKQADYANRISISALKGANTTDAIAYEICQNGGEIKFYSDEQPPIVNAETGARSKFLSGGPACDEIITGINGLGAPNVKIVGGAGIQVIADPNNPHTIRLKRADNLLTENC